MFVQIWFFFLSELARVFVFFVGVGSVEIEKELISRGLGHEVGTVFEILDFVKLKLHEVVDCLDVGLHAMCAGIDGVVMLSGK